MVTTTGRDAATAPKIESLDLSLGDLFKDFYSVPDFQREYVWEAENVEKLLTDVLDEFYDEDNRLAGESEYFIGSIVACRDEAGTFQLIDGQQRVTTIYLAVIAIRDHLRERSESVPVALEGFIQAVSMDRRTGESISRYRVALQYEDSQGVLEKLADGRTSPADIPESTASVRHVLGAYRAIRDFLGINFGDDCRRLKEFMAAFMFRVKLIRILTPNLAHALKVFETINDRGIGLNAMDLLKNLLFMRTRPADYPRLREGWRQLVDTLDQAKEKPLRFLRYYIMSHHTIDRHHGLREDEIYDWFVEKKNREACGIDARPLAFVDDLVGCARNYRNFLKGKSPAGEDIPYLQNISMLAGGLVRQHLILLLAGQHLPTDLFTELCRHIENLFFCYIITREPTKTFERNFARWSKDLRAVHDADGLKAFVAANFHGEMAARSKNFDFAFRELSQSKIQQYRMRYILAKLTQHIDLLAWGNPAHATLKQYVDGAVHVEHILPRTPAAGVREAFDKPAQYDAYVGRLGNLTLLEKSVNTSVSNGPFKDKLPGYKQSAFLLTKSIAEKPQVGVNTQVNRAVEDLISFGTWDSAAIENRQEMLLRLGRKVWMPELLNPAEG